MPEGARLQLASTGAGELRVMLSEVSSPSVAGQPCGTPPQVFAAPHGAWSRYEGTLTLTRSSADLQLCAYVHEHGYMPSAVSSALLRVRPWTQPVRIATLEPPPGLPAVTVTLAGPEGAIVWYALEAIDDSPLCEARAMAARVAPNLTLAADAAWLHAMQLQARPTATHQLACLHANLRWRASPHRRCRALERSAPRAAAPRESWRATRMGAGEPPPRSCHQAQPCAVLPALRPDRIAGASTRESRCSSTRAAPCAPSPSWLAASARGRRERSSTSACCLARPRPIRSARTTAPPLRRPCVRSFSSCSTPLSNARTSTRSRHPRHRRPHRPHPRRRRPHRRRLRHHRHRRHRRRRRRHRRHHPRLHHRRSLRCRRLRRRPASPPTIPSWPSSRSPPLGAGSSTAPSPPECGCS